MSDVESRLRECEKEVHSINNSLSNGHKSFAELREQVAMILPKRIEWSRIVFGVASVLITFGTLTYTLSEKFSDRPRFDQLDGIVKPIRESQKASARRLEELRIVQYEQKAAIEALEKDIAEHAVRLKELKKVRRKR